MMRRVRIGIIDSGVNLEHPHIGGIAGGINITQADQNDSYVDQLGHGTAIAALIHAEAPQAELFAVKVFQRSLATYLDIVLRAIDWCISQDMDLINLSLGTTNAKHSNAFERSVTSAFACAKLIISAYEMNGVPAVPGCLPNVIGVSADYAKSPYQCWVELRDGKNVFSACPYARETPGIPRERNLHGVSFAVARITGILGSLCQSSASVLEGERLLLDHALQRGAFTHSEINPNAPARNRPAETVTSAHS